jgi:hypothetical protein
MSHAVGPYSVEEHLVHGETRWVAIRARGAEWSWLTPEEAVAIGREWIERYGAAVATKPHLVAAE